MQKQTFLFFRTAGFCLIILSLLAFLAACGTSTTGGINSSSAHQYSRQHPNE